MLALLRIFVLWCLRLVSSDETHLRIHVRGSNNPFLQAPAAQHSFLQMEVHNIHPTETAILYDVHVHSETTRYQNQPVTVPSQFHVARMPGPSLELHAEQMAILPLSLVPRFAPYHEAHWQQRVEWNATNVWHAYASSLSNTGRRTHLVNPDHYEYQLSAILQVSSSRGDLQTPLQATSVLSNVPSWIPFVNPALSSSWNVQAVPDCVDVHLQTESVQLYLTSPGWTLSTTTRSASGGSDGSKPLVTICTDTTNATVSRDWMHQRLTPELRELLELGSYLIIESANGQVTLIALEWVDSIVLPSQPVQTLPVLHHPVVSARPGQFLVPAPSANIQDASLLVQDAPEWLTLEYANETVSLQVDWTQVHQVTEVEAALLYSTPTTLYHRPLHLKIVPLSGIGLKLIPNTNITLQRIQYPYAPLSRNPRANVTFRTLHFHHALTKVVLSSASIVGGDICQECFSIAALNASRLTLRYDYSEHWQGDTVVTCGIDFGTQPDTGVHQLSLYIYPAVLDVSGSPYTSNVVQQQDQDQYSEQQETSPWYGALFGFEALVKWFAETSTGQALKQILLESVDGKSDALRNSDSILLGRYLYSLAKRSVQLESSRLRPVLLQVGAIGNETERMPLYLTNHNPVNIFVFLDVSHVEGMSISLGRDALSSNGGDVSMLEYLREEGDVSSSVDVLKGHPRKGIHQFLQQSAAAQSYFAEFPYRNAVSPSPLARKHLPVLGTMDTYPVEIFHRHATEPMPANASCSGRPAPYGRLGTSFRGQRRLPGPLIVSHDGTKRRALQICSESKDNTTAILIPPGYMARFDIELIAPTRYLDKDITQFVSTGIVLSTDYDEVIPLFVAFDALQGRLDVAQDAPVIDVPLGLFGKESNSSFDSIFISKDSEPSNVSHVDTQDGDVPLSLQSSFARDINVQRILSCNPLFSVSTISSVASISNSVTCGDDDGRLFPSFFQCALSWLRGRSALQPRGCGSSVEEDAGTEQKELTVRDDFQGISSVLGSLEAAIVSSFARYPQTANETLDAGEQTDSTGLVESGLLKAAAGAWNAWSRASSVNLHRIATSLRAVVEYNTTDRKSWLQSSKEQNHTLSVSIRNITIQSNLDVPRLLNSDGAPPTLKFPSTPVGEVSSVMIPLYNPTNAPVRVKLATLPQDFERSSELYNGEVEKFLGVYKPPFVQTREFMASSVADGPNFPWWGPLSYYYHYDSYGVACQTDVNITITKANGARMTVFSPTTTYTNGFSIPCYNRCGLRMDTTNQQYTSFFSPFGVSAAKTMELTGKPRGTSGEPLEIPDDLVAPPKLPSPFAISYHALDEITLPPHSHSELGPVFFRPTGKLQRDHEYDFESIVLLENSLSGIERVHLTGTTAWSQLAFVDSEFNGDKTTTELLNGTHTVYFQSLSHTHLQPDEFNFTPEYRKVLLANTGNVPVNVSAVTIYTTADYSGYTLDKCQAGEFRLRNCEDIEPFVLLPGENQSLSLAHYPTCSFPTSSATLVAAAVELYEGHPSRHRKYNIKVDHKWSLGMYTQCFSSSQKKLREDRAEEKGSNEATAKDLLTSFLTWLSSQPAKYILLMSLVIVAVLVLGFTLSFSATREVSVEKFHGYLRHAFQQNRDMIGASWYSAYRCLSRIDPSPTELASLASAQSRQIALLRYRKMGVTPPMYYSSSAVLNRQRLGRSKEPVKPRTLSDALFMKYESQAVKKGPCRLGWRLAASRGIIRQNSLEEKCPLVFEYSEEEIEVPELHDHSESGDISTRDDTEVMTKPQKTFHTVPIKQAKQDRPLTPKKSLLPIAKPKPDLAPKLNGLDRKDPKSNSFKAVEGKNGTHPKSTKEVKGSNVSPKPAEFKKQAVENTPPRVEIKEPTKKKSKQQGKKQQTPVVAMPVVTTPTTTPIRPPPGLSPPPGFNGGNPVEDDPYAVAAASYTEFPPLQTPSHDTTGVAIPKESVSSSNNESDFDVLAFLDDILKDGNEKTRTDRGDLYEDDLPTLPRLEHNPFAVSAAASDNPWATETQEQHQPSAILTDDLFPSLDNDPDKDDAPMMDFYSHLLNDPK